MPPNFIIDLAVIAGTSRVIDMCHAYLNSHGSPLFSHLQHIVPEPQLRTLCLDFLKTHGIEDKPYVPPHGVIACCPVHRHLVDPKRPVFECWTDAPPKRCNGCPYGSGTNTSTITSTNTKTKRAHPSLVNQSNLQDLVLTNLL